MKKLILAIILLVLIPLRHFGQTPYRQYSDEGVVLDFHSINNVYLRAFLLYSINNDNRFVLIPEEKYGQFTLTPKDDDCHFMEEFESFYADVENDFSLLSKIDVTNQMSVWKSSVEASDYLSIMMDVNTANMRADNDHCINSMPRRCHWRDWSRIRLPLQSALSFVVSYENTYSRSVYHSHGSTRQLRPRQ